MSVDARPTADAVRNQLEYDPATGVFLRKCGRRRDQPAGRLNSQRGYHYIHIGGREYVAHRLAWVWMTGEWPALEVDHINGQRSDNRWANLRLASASQNRWNSCKRARNTSGFKGVTFDKSRGKWMAQICIHRRNMGLGRFDTPEAAHEAYTAAALRLHGEFARPS